MNKKGFTYVELILVLSILAIMASIAIPTFKEYRVKANNAAALSDLKNVRTVLELYYDEHGHYP